MTEDYVHEVIKNAIKFNIITIEEVNDLKFLSDDVFMRTFNNLVIKVEQAIQLRNNAITASVIALGPKRADEYLENYGQDAFEENAIKAYNEINNKLKE